MSYGSVYYYKQSYAIQIADDCVSHSGIFAIAFLVDEGVIFNPGCQIRILF